MGIEMKRLLRALLLLLIVVAAGLGTSELLYRWRVVQPIFARLLSPASARLELVNLRNASSGEQIPEAVIDRELDLLRHQFADENQFVTALKSSGSSLATLRTELTENLRGRQWIEKMIAPELGVSEAECRAFYDAASESFVLPQRFCAKHIFLAAPPETPPEVLSAKRTLIQGLAIRILAGEDFDALVLEASEDEGTKNQGGDLGYFSALRMPPEFIAEAEKLDAGDLSGPIQSHLGFHILRMSDAQAPKRLVFDEVKTEIANWLENNQRRRAVAQLAERLKAPELGRNIH